MSNNDNVVLVFSRKHWRVAWFIFAFALVLLVVLGVLYGSSTACQSGVLVGGFLVAECVGFDVVGVCELPSGDGFALVPEYNFSLEVVS